MVNVFDIPMCTHKDYFIFIPIACNTRILSYFYFVSHTVHSTSMNKLHTRNKIKVSDGVDDDDP
jgi:hypothetical protein